MPLPLALLPIAARLAPVRRILGFVPTWAWVALAIALAGLLGALWHGKQVRQTIDAAEKRGEERAYKRVEAKARAIEARAKDIGERIAAEMRSRHNEELRRNADLADSIRLRGPGKAACPGSPGLPAGAGRPEPAGGRSDAPVDRVPGEERVELIAVPFGELVGRAERCDALRIEVLSWRTWHPRMVVEWEKLRR